MKQGRTWMTIAPAPNHSTITRATIQHTHAHPLLAGSARLTRALAQRRAELGAYRAQVDDQPKEQVLESLLLMHHNRLMGPDHASEAAARHAARQACRSLRRAAPLLESRTHDRLVHERPSQRTRLRTGFVADGQSTAASPLCAMTSPGSVKNLLYTYRMRMISEAADAREGGRDPGYAPVPTARDREAAVRPHRPATVHAAHVRGSDGHVGRRVRMASDQGAAA
ncbi:lantibiotic dehydratase C-terminal domain-containing protein [Streptomyces iakyrus]|uniref:lantibiotic dehydratase C-terminal domain-containing protein n=1 Tax=Streptomyces iakyrus TaxID=68219 RepID=UPI0036EA3C56